MLYMDTYIPHGELLMLMVEEAPQKPEHGADSQLKLKYKHSGFMSTDEILDISRYLNEIDREFLY